MSIEVPRTNFLDGIVDLMPRLECRRIKKKEDFKEVFSLRYRAYVAKELIPENPDNISIDAYDLLDNCQTFGIYLDGKLASSIRLHKVTPDQPGCPSLKYFGDILRPKMQQGYTFIDGSRFCVDPSIVNEVTIIPFLTVRIAYMASIYFGITHNISVVRKEHGAFYRRYFGFEKWSGDTALDWYKLPVTLYVGDIDKNRQNIETRLPFMRSSFDEQLMLFSDELPVQGLCSIKGMFGNRVTNSVKDAESAPQLSEWLTVSA